jgi:predicted RNA-binding protein (virulence factor B family)
MNIGQYNLLLAQRSTSVGWYLQHPNGDEVLLPQKWVPSGLQVDDKLKVFIYLDADERPIATTLTPKATVGSFAYLPVRQVSKVGAFLDWGLEKDLFVPFQEMDNSLQEGQSYVVALYIDGITGRITASSRLKRFFKEDTSDLELNQQVEILVYKQTDLGYLAVVNQAYSGLLYHNQLFEKVNIGQSRKAFVQAIRPDAKVDLILQQPGIANIEPNAQKVLDLIKKEGGFLALHDKSKPEDISARLKMSKKTFKKAVGSLYKQKLIQLENGKGMRLS